MTEPVAKANPSVEIEGHLVMLYGEEKGWVYAPTKRPGDEYWQEYYFRWPEQKTSIITHILGQSPERDCYVAPSLFKAPSAKRPSWKGSNYVWVEFDGNTPKTLPTGIPDPSFRVQSSVSKHEHWYWRLDSYQRDRNVLEGLTKSLAYTLDSDKSGWECNQVLRPPGTIHQESKKRVKLLASNDRRYGFNDFKNLVATPDAVIVDTAIDKLPDSTEVVAKYKWPEDAIDLFNKPTQKIGTRSSAMTRLGLHCIEMGMSNEEAYVILYNADERWKKYKSRPPASRAKRLLGIIEYCRSKKELDAELNLAERDTFVSVGDFRKTDVKVKWLYENLIAEKGLGILSALPGVGKSTLSIRMGICMVLGKDFLIWKFLGEKKKVGFLSLEMAGLECRAALDTMWPSFKEEEKETIDRNFFILPLGYSMNLAGKKEQQALLDEIDNHKIDVLIIDSLKAATGIDEKKVDVFFDWINKYVRSDRGCTVWIIHHNRKPANEGPRKPRGLEDLYGDTFIGAHPTTVIALWRRAKGIIEVLPLKIRLAEETDPFVINRGKYLNFKVDLKSLIPKEGKGSDEDGEGEVKSDGGMFK